MSRKLFICGVFSFGILFFLQSISFSEIYKFRDKNGVLQYTDNFENVPEDQRDSENAYSVLDDTTDTEPKDILENPLENKIDDNPVHNDSILQYLNKEKEKLDVEYENLQEKADLLNKEQSNVINRPYDRTLYEEKVKKLNAEIEDYENRRKAFEKEAKSMNLKQ
jgi:peptidoglycan hydrolase CwlO-like protein